MADFDAALCDLDGTLVDSEGLHMDAWMLVVTKLDLGIPKEQVEDCVAKPDASVAERLVAAFPHLRVEDLLAQKHAFYMELARSKGAGLAYPGVREKLRRLRAAGLKLAVGTNSARETCRYSLETSELDAYFDAIVTLDMVANPKPAPDIYREAARRLGAAPERCCVLEDSPLGLASGRAAGCRTLGITTSWQAEALADSADRVFGSTADAMEWVLERSS